MNNSYQVLRQPWFEYPPPPPLLGLVLIDGWVPTSVVKECCGLWTNVSWWAELNKFHAVQRHKLLKAYPSFSWTGLMNANPVEGWMCQVQFRWKVLASAQCMGMLFIVVRIWWADSKMSLSLQRLWRSCSLHWTWVDEYLILFIEWEPGGFNLAGKVKNLFLVTIDV